MEQNSPLVSILLPTHNRADVLPFAIQSVLAQTIPNFELLIVGDGCTDNTAEVVQGFADPRIRWFDLPKAPGFGYANRNIALKSARGEYIAFMAHDDLWMSDHLELMLPLFKDKNIEIAYSRPLWVIPLGMIVPGTFDLNFPPVLKAFLNKEMNAIPAGCFIHRRECFFKYGYWDASLPSSADWDMWIRIIKGGGEKNFIYLSSPTCLHFKANWHNEYYDMAFGFNFWRRLFAVEGLMPDPLNIPVADGETEQKAIWYVIDSGKQEWEKQIRSAIQSVLDQRAFHDITLTEGLINFYGAYTQIPIKLQSIVDFDAPHLIQPLIQITEFSFARKMFNMIITFIRRWRPKFKNPYG